MHVVCESQSTILHQNTRQKQTPNFSAKLKIFRRKDPCRKIFFAPEVNWASQGENGVVANTKNTLIEVWNEIVWK